MTMMSDLSYDLIEEILCRVPITSLGAVRCTCKVWNTLSKNRILCKAEARDQFLGFATMDHKLFSMRFNLQGILNEYTEDFLDPSIKPIGPLFTHDNISKISYCDGLLLCVTRTKNSIKIAFWNPYLGQTRWIKRRIYHIGAMFALGYDNKKNHKILMFVSYHNYYQIYDLKSRSWTLFDVFNPNWKINSHQRGVSLNGNTYFLAKEKKGGKGCEFLLSFDFTTEKFGQLLDIPFPYYFQESGILSCVKEEKLALLYQRDYTSLMEIWVTSKIEPNAVSWSKFLEIDMKPLIGFFGFRFYGCQDSFFIDEETKMAVVFSLGGVESYTKAYIIGDHRHLRVVDLEIVNPQESVEVGERFHCFSPLVCCCSYVPSLVQINQRKEKKSNCESKEKKSNCERKDKKRKRTNKG